VIDFEAFRARLIEEIQSWQSAHPYTSEGWTYYERWQRALERALIEHGVVTDAEIGVRAAEIAHERAHDHDGHETPPAGTGAAGPGALHGRTTAE